MIIVYLIKLPEILVIILIHGCGLMVYRDESAHWICNGQSNCVVNK